MVHNRTIGFPCNFGWWRQQQIAFFQVKTGNFPLRKFQVASHNTEEWGWVYDQWSTRSTSHENLTHFIWHRVHGRNSELCLSFFFPIYQSAFLCQYLSSNVNIYFMLSNQQTWSTDQLEHLESFCSASKAKDSSLVYNSRLSFVLSYQPIRF